MDEELSSKELVTEHALESLESCRPVLVVEDLSMDALQLLITSLLEPPSLLILLLLDGSYRFRCLWVGGGLVDVDNAAAGRNIFGSTPS